MKLCLCKKENKARKTPLNYALKIQSAYMHITVVDRLIVFVRYLKAFRGCFGSHLSASLLRRHWIKLPYMSASKHAPSLSMLEGLPGLNKDRVLQRCNHLPHSRNFPEEFPAVRLLCIGAFSQPAYRTTSNSAVLVHNHSFSGLFFRSLLWNPMAIGNPLPHWISHTP